YRDLQKLAERYHISVITEISTPGHSGCFSSIVPDLMLDSSHLDVSNPDTVAFVKSVLGEYIEGSHPVITSGKLHLGADEYPEGYEESLCDYLVELIKYCESKKVTARFWGSLQADVSKSLLENAKRSKAECSFWAPAMLNGQDLLDAGISVINSCASVLNCVPGGNHGFPDYADIETLYSQWFVRYLGSGASSEASGHVSLIEGASFSLWNDLSYLRGYSRQDMFDRMRYLIAFVAEKTWTGDHTADLTPESFMERFSIVSQLKGQDLPCGIPKTDIQEELASEYEWIGFPYLIEADLVWNGSVGDSVIFGGTEGYLAVDTNGSLYFRREYGFLSTGKTDFGEKQFDGVGMRYDYQLQEGVPTHIALYGTDELTVLVVDGIYAFLPEPISPNGYNQSKTFCVPFRNVGSSGAIVENVEIKPYPEEFEDQRADGNLALKKHAVYNGPDAQPAEARALVDGNEDTIFRFSDGADVQDFLVDLGSVHSTNQIAIRFSDHVPAYEVSVSENGEDFELLYRTDSGPEGGEKEDVLQYPLQKGRYFRFRQMRRIQSGEDAEPRGGGVSEFEIYGFDSEKYESVLIESAEWPDDERLNDAVSELRKALLKSRIYLFEVEPLTDRVRERIEELKEEDRIRKDAEESRRIEESVREESIRAEESRAEEEKRNSPLPWILFAVSVLAVAGAVLLFNLRNRSGRRNK
ncbi:MAG: discoidin domain-containing protein, partial [Clostridia bacterium]|nr:discoidin domain-containing protein [Clostridia bacterium]